MTALALLFSLAALGAVAWVHVRTIERFEQDKTAPRQSYDDSELRAALDDHADHIDTLQEQIRAQTLAIDEGIRHVDRSERRVRAVVTRAQKRLEEHDLFDPALDGEAEQLRLGNGEGSAEESVHPMRPNVAAVQTPDMSVFPGQWSPEDFGG